MKKNLYFKYSFFILSFFLSQNELVACTCSSISPIFCNNAKENHYIVQAVVNSFPEFELMEVTILENLHQEISEETIMVMGHDGLNCGELLEIFDPQDTLILALGIWSDGQNETFYLDGCGRHYLNFENGLVTGQIINSITTQTLDEFRDNILNCIEITSSVENLQGEEIRLFPNPNTDQFQIAMERSSINGFEIYNANGKQMVSETLDYSVFNLTVKSTNLETGIHYIRIYTEEGILTKRFLRF